MDFMQQQNFVTNPYNKHRVRIIPNQPSDNLFLAIPLSLHKNEALDARRE